ncbi:hypothetical protein G9A89_010022 [Geosiphon pyriformis]|nr:hypothetical protein G9A89_010022 [Geosiphon pyriformis]
MDNFFEFIVDDVFTLRTPAQSAEFTFLARSWFLKFTPLSTSGTGDVEIKGQGIISYASSIVLANRSEYFRNIFARTWAENYIRLFAEQSEGSNKQTIFCLADEYLLDELRDKAKARFMRDLKFQNAAMTLLTICTKYLDLKDLFLTFVAANFTEVGNTQDFAYIATHFEEFPGSPGIMAEL